MSGEQTRDCVLMGAGGHAKVVLALAQVCGRAVGGVIDPALAEKKERPWRGLPVLGGDEVLERLSPAYVDILIGIGFMPGSSVRRDLYERVVGMGFQVPALVHPAAWVAPSVKLAAGVQVMAGAVVQPDACVGEGSIINTGARVDHDAQVGAHVHLAPGAVLCGDVRVGDGAFIGAGAVVVQGVQIGERAVLGAGALALGNIGAGARQISVVKGEKGSA